MKTKAVILAAGKGTRMKSDKPKVLHKILDHEMIRYVVDAVTNQVNEKPVVVIGHGGDQVKEALAERADTVWQKEQLGTGHGVMMAKEAIKDSDRVIVMCGDTPLIREETIAALVAEHEKENNQATVLSVIMAEPFGYGRIIKASGQVTGIVEEKDATEEERAIQEINSGMYCFQSESLLRILEQLEPKNAQGEYYLTDVLSILHQQGEKVGAYLAADSEEIAGINDRVQLADATAQMQMRINREWMKKGVSMLNPSCVYIGIDVMLSKDVEIWPGVILEGDSVVGEATVLGPNCRLKNARIGARCHLDTSIVLDSSMKDDCTIGPFAYIRPGSSLADRVKIGDFVEIKKTSVDEGSKLPHHSYVGDAIIGKGVNIGAGTITCNYDGVNKYQTKIEDGVFVGSNSNLVAPLHLKERAYVAAGSTITEDVPEESLAIARGRQKNLPGWRKKKGL
jgi:bifunctional UDP-N-acetylglucosamine pyrophosphorylase/glucosamine-1-phosphate N-acetyltransferase